MMSRRIAASLAALLLMIPTLPALHAAPAELAAIAVSLTVQETCMVQSADAVISVANQPVVSCLHGAPFQITEAGFDPVMPAADASHKAVQPVEFVASHDAQQTVWMVNF